MVNCMARNNLTFSLPIEQIEKLESLSKEGESPALVAKRILLQFLDGEAKESATIGLDPETKQTLEDLDNRLQEIENRLEALEELPPPNPNLSGLSMRFVDQLETLTKKIAMLENQIAGSQVVRGTKRKVL
jgi:hypothetical protein